MQNDEKTTHSNEPFDFTKAPFLSGFPKVSLFISPTHFCFQQITGIDIFLSFCNFRIYNAIYDKKSLWLWTYDSLLYGLHRFLFLILM